jgi:hypothetical protein
MAEAVSGFSREDKATAMHVLSLSGKPSVSWSGPAVSTLIRKVFGLPRHRPGRFLGEAAMTNAGSLGRDAALHIPACVRSRHGAIWQAAFRVAAHGAVDAHKDHEKDVGAEAFRGSRGREEG